MVDSKSNLEKILVCVSSAPSAATLITTARKIADRMHAKLYAVHVEVPVKALLSEAERDRLMGNLRLAEQLGAETHTLTGRDVAEEMMNYARQQNITRIVVGKPGRSRMASIFLKSPVDHLLRISGDIPVEIVSGGPVEPAQPSRPIQAGKFSLSDYGTGLIYLLLATGLCFLMFPYFHLSNLIMVYLLAVLVTSIDCGRGPGIFASLVSVLAFDFCFVPPRWTFTVDEAQYFVTFAVMFVVAVAISHLASVMRKQTMTARLQERQAAAMHGLSRQLAASRGIGKTMQIAVEYISEIFDSRVVLLAPEGAGKLKVAAGDASSVFRKDFTREMGMAREAFEKGVTTGLETQAAPDAEIIYVPLQVANATLGVLALRPKDPEKLLAHDKRYLLESLVKQVALSLEVEYLAASGVTMQPDLAIWERDQTEVDVSVES